MTRQETITKPSANTATERRRINRVRHLLVVGWTIEEIRSEMRLSYNMVSYYYELSLNLKESEDFRNIHDLKYKELKGLEWGSKTTQYYPSDMYSEEESWVIPEYNFDELSEEEIAFYNSTNQELNNKK
jgi:hypothetical protein